MNESIDPASGNVETAANTGHIEAAASNGESRANSRALMVRDYEAGLSPFVGSPMAGAYVDGAPVGVNFTQLLHALRRRWLLALCTGLLVGVPLAALVWLVTPENYEVIAWLRVGDPPTFNRNSVNATRNPTEYEQYRKTQSARIKSPLVLNAALNKPGIADLPMMRDQKEPLKFLEDELIVVSPMESEVLQIKMRGKDARQLVKIVNAVKEAYLIHIVNAEMQASYRKRDVLEDRYKESMAEILDKRNKVRQLAIKHNAPDLEQVKVRTGILMQRSQTLWNEIMHARSLMRDLQVDLAMSKEKGGAIYVPTEDEVDMEIMSDPMMQRLQQKLAELQQYQGMQRGYAKRGERDSSVQQLVGQANALQQQMEERRAEIRQPILQRIQRERNREQGLLKTPEEMELNVKILQEEIDKLQKEYDTVSTEVATLSQESADVDSMLGEIHQLENNAAELNGQLDALKIELSLPPRVTSLDDATEPEGTNPIMRYVLTALAGLSGIFLGAATVVAMEYHAHRLNTSSELGTTVGLRVLGTVPSLSALSRTKGMNGSAALHGILGESVDRIRTILLQQSAADAPHVLLISSAGDREGKTTVASQLAASLARGGRRTLLVDGDLRSPTAHTTFGAAPEPGLCEVLRGEVDLAGAIQPTSVDGLMLVAGGQCDYHAIAALSKDALKDVLQRARDQFEFVVIDAAPVLIYADTLLMGAHADAAVLSVRRDVSQLHKVYEAKDRMESVGIRVLGAVVNGISETNRRPAFAFPAAVE